jgi:Flp pilus assembly pilin Flp
MNKNTLATIVSNGIVKLIPCAIIAIVTEVESSLDDTFTHMMKKRL